MIKSITLLLSFLVLTPILNDQKTIMFFGDSITAGYGLDPVHAYPSVLDSLLDNRGFNVKIINAGSSGETSAGGLNRIDWVLRQKVDIFVLELGANDGLRGLPLEQTSKNLTDIIRRVRLKYPDVDIVIAGMMVPPNLGEDYTVKFKKIYPTLAKEYNATFIPFLLNGVAGKADLNLADGIHPNVEGHKIVANNILNTFIELL